MPHSGLVTFGIHLGKLRKVIILMVFGPSGSDHDSQNQLILVLWTSNDFKLTKKPAPIISTHTSTSFGHHKMLGQGPNNPEDPSNVF